MLRVPTELETVVDFVRWTASTLGASEAFYGHGADNAIDEALALVLPALFLEPGLPSEFYSAKLTEDEKDRLTQFIRRRIEERIPAAYITHRSWFAGLSFYVDERVLIPRSPIAELIDAHFSPWIPEEHLQCALELGTGSGCIAIAMAYALPHITIDAVDISADALKVAAHNVHTHGMEARVRLVQSDLFAEVTGRYDLIITNPPYVESGAIDTLADEYRKEPRIALDGGREGLAIVHRILYTAPDYLSPGGVLIVEIGDTRDTLMERYPDIPFSWCDFERGGDHVLILTREELTLLERPSGEGATPFPDP